MAGNHTDIIVTQNLSKYYGKLAAVENLSLRVKKGEIYGLLGLNGAGKTTTIRMLLGIIKPSSGVSYLNGKKVISSNHNLWKNVGYLVEIPYSYPDLTVYENLDIFRRMRLISDSSVVDSAITQFHLSAYRNMKAKNLSQGNAQRLGLAKAMIHNPEILILDEPANGLDPAGIVEIRELLRDLSLKRGVTIFISSHLLDEISKLATRIGIIHSGRLIQEITSYEFKHLQRKKLILNARDKDLAKQKLEKEGYLVNFTPNAELEITDENAVNHPELIASILVHANVPPTLLKVEESNLEAYFLDTIAKGIDAK